MIAPDRDLGIKFKCFACYVGAYLRSPQERALSQTPRHAEHYW